MQNQTNVLENQTDDFWLQNYVPDSEVGCEWDGKFDLVSEVK